jgi:hypothetical protein
MNSSGSFEAVFMFGKKGIAKEMLYQEFESVLDGLIGTPSLADKKVQAAYVEINSSLNIKALVFFTISFDKQGMADSTWNLPLDKLARKGVQGPDLGAGPVSIYMQGGNEIDDYDKYLWDPGERAGSNDLIHVRDAVRKNRLCLSSDDDSEERMGNAAMGMREPSNSYGDEDDVPVATSTLASDDNDEFSQAIKIIESQRIKITALENALTQNKPKKNDGLEKAFSESKLELENIQKRLLESQKNEEKLTLLKEKLEEKLEERKKAVKKSEQENEQIQLLVKKTEKQGQEKLERAKEKYQKNLQLESEKIENKLTKRITELEQEKLDSASEITKEKEAELHKERQKIESLNKELTSLRGEKFRLMKDGAEGFFKKIDAADISFMTFKPGAGHITITVDEIGGYIEDPDSFLAKKCGVSLEEYHAWRDHYDKPICLAPLPDKQVCGKTIFRSDSPAKFNPGSTDRCQSHGGR